VYFQRKALTQRRATIEVVFLTAIVVAIALPLYYYRNRLVGWFRGKLAHSTDRSG